jgi:hypothetical protein
MWNPFRRRRYTLVAMRLANMMVGHADMTTNRVCSLCGETVGIYPSGQRVIAAHGKRVDIVCEVCHGPLSPGARPAPGSLREVGESRPLHGR